MEKFKRDKRGVLIWLLIFKIVVAKSSFFLFKKHWYLEHRLCYLKMVTAIKSPKRCSEILTATK